MMQYNIYYNIEPDYWGVAPCWIIGGGLLPKIFGRPSF